MKKKITLLLILVLSITSIVAYAEIQPRVQFIYEYEYDPVNYEYENTYIATDAIMDNYTSNGVLLASGALSALSANPWLLFAGGSIAAAYNTYVDDNYDYRMIVSSRYKRKYRVNLLTQERTLVTTWKQSKTETYYGCAATDTWTYESTEYDEFVMQ